MLEKVEVKEKENMSKKLWTQLPIIKMHSLKLQGIIFVNLLEMPDVVLFPKLKVPKFKKKSLVIDCVTDFQQWLVERLWLKDRDELVSFLQYSSNDSSERPRRRPLQSRDERKRGYNFSKLNSEISIHRSNSIIWCK